ncbi:MAG: BlaI/MecI/CopY family transcriptional regulator [Planctomycetaceae bacterium]|nr:BlaI/MecI/CopY family transcriptional regulator [Planctomycetaceae bacterium]
MGGSKKKTPLELGKRERQIYETVLAAGEASVSDVKAKLQDPPSYSAVRATMNLLVEKNWLKFRQVGQKYLYRPAAGQEKARLAAVRRLLSSVFGDSPTDAVAALLDATAGRLTDEQLQEMSDMIQKARKENQS